MHVIRRLRAPLLGGAALALSATVALAGSGGLSTAAGHANSHAQDALAAALAAAQAGLAKADAAGAPDSSADVPSAVDRLAAALTAAQSGLAKAADALANNPTDADAGGLAGLSTAGAAAAGLAKAEAATTAAGSQAGDHGPSH